MRKPVTRRIFALLAFAAVLLVHPPVLQSKVYIDINAPGGRRFPVAVPFFYYEGGPPQDAALAQMAAETVGRDLSFSGVFEVLDRRMYLVNPVRVGSQAKDIDFQDWTTIGAQALVAANLRVEGNQVRITGKVYDTTDGSLIVGREFIGARSDVRYLAHLFSNQIMKSFTGVRGIFTTRIAAVGVDGRSKEIYVMDYDGYNRRRITRNGSLNLAPSWTPDGRGLLYTSYKRGNPDLYFFDLASGRERLVSHRFGLNLGGQWSPRGNLIALTLDARGGNSEIYLINDQGKIVRQLTRTWGINVSPSWSPDGGQIAFASGRSGSPQIYIMDSSGKGVHRITFRGSYNTSPAWSPTGNKIAYTSRIRGRFQVAVINPDGNGYHVLTSSAGNNEDPSWSPDGRYLAFTSTREGGNPQIYIMDALGGNAVAVTPAIAGMQDPAWSPWLEH